MARKILLDSGPLGEVTHPRAEKRAQIRQWLTSQANAGSTPTLPEIVDYEHRRKLLHLDATRQIQRLDEFKEVFGYLPLTTNAMLKASELWAEAKKRGAPTVPADALDIDVILAAQAWMLEADDDEVIVATTNSHHFSRFVDARSWQDIEP